MKTLNCSDNKKILDIGCGNQKVVPSAIGMDRARLSGVDIVHDINNFPWPIQDEEYDVLYAYMVLEHVDDLLKTMAEIHRIVKKGGLVYIKVPYFSSECAFGDPTHKHFFTEKSFLFFTDDFPLNYYTDVRFAMIEQKLMNGNDSVLEKIRNLIPFKRILKRVFLNMYDEIYVVLKKI